MADILGSSETRPHIERYLKMEYQMNSESFHDLSMTSQDFTNWGTDTVAYLKPEHQDGIAGYAIYSADGQHLAFVEDRNHAKALVLENELVPVYVQ